MLKLILSVAVLSLGSSAFAQAGPSVEDAKYAYQTCVAYGFHALSAVRLDGTLVAYGDIRHSVLLALPIGNGKKMEIFCDAVSGGEPIVPPIVLHPDELGRVVEPGYQFDPRYRTDDGNTVPPGYPYPLPMGPPRGDPLPPDFGGQFPGFGG